MGAAYLLADNKRFPEAASFPRAKGWRADTAGAVRKGTLRPASPITVREAADAWLKGAHEGTIRARNGLPYRPSVLRSYESALRLRVLPDLGGRKLADVSRFDLQYLVDRMLAKGFNPSTIQTR
jgi:hypothetical protein